MSTVEMATKGSGCPAGAGSTALRGDESCLDPLIRKNPFSFYRTLREHDPVYYDPKLDTYLVSRYEDVMTVLRDPLTYSLEHRSEEHTSELQSLMRISYAVFC